MKVLKYSEFLKMPSGTIYRPTHQEFSVGDISIKGKTEQNNYWSHLQLGNPEFWNEDFMGFKGGQRFKTDNEGYQNGGWYRDDATFIVFELEDLLTLYERINQAINSLQN